MIKVIGFDLDNTLYNQELFEFEIFRQISTIVAENFKIDDSQYLKTLIALYHKGEKDYIFDKAAITVNYALPIQWDQFIVKNILPLYRSFKPNSIYLYENKENTLNYLKTKDYKLVLITNGNSNIQNNKINALNIRKYFDLILISDDFEPKRRKPDTFMFESALNHFNVKPHEMIFVGDDLISDKASELIGIRFININDFSLKKIGEESEL